MALDLNIIPAIAAMANIDSKYDSFIHFTMKFNSKDYFIVNFAGIFNSKNYSIIFFSWKIQVKN